jgi:hypothetical protein
MEEKIEMIESNIAEKYIRTGPKLRARSYDHVAMVG